MIRSLSSAATGMQAQSFLVDVTANNIANANTTGFKRAQVSFQDLIYSTLRGPGNEVVGGLQVPTGLQVGNGVSIAGTENIFTQGPLDNTGNPLDVAIQGEGFFQITLPDGTFRYSRDGSFRLTATGQIVTTNGFLLTPPITIPSTTISITIATDGTVTAFDGVNNTVVGNITLGRFPNPGGLSSEGSNLFRETPASGPVTLGTPGTTGFGTLQQGFLERSNVEVVTELVNLILAQRIFEFNTRVVRVSDDMLLSTANLVRL